MANPVIQTSALMNAVRTGNLDGVVLAIAHGADIEESDMHGHPGLPLRTACFSGHYDIVLTLLDHGANVNAPTAEGNGAPLRLARRARHQHIASLLLERGAELPYDELPSANKATTPPPKVGTGNDEANAGGLPQLAITEPMASTGFSDLRQHPRPESNVIEFTSVPIPFSGAKPPETEAHGSSIEFSQESIPSVPTAAAAAVITTLPPPPAPETAADITVAPTSPEAFVDSPAQGYIEEIEMSTPYGVDTEILARDLSRLAAGTDIPPGGKSGR